MIQALRDFQKMHGAILSSLFSEGAEVPLSFGDGLAVTEAIQSGVAIADRTHWGRIQVTDADRLRFLHNQTTNDFNTLKPGQGCDTVFVTSTGRTIDLATAYVTEESVVLLVSPNRRQFLMPWMDRYIFFADKVCLTDVTETTATFSLLGKGCDQLLEKVGLEAIVGRSYGTHCLMPLVDGEVRVAVGSGLAIPGYTLITDVSHAVSLWKCLVEMGAVPMGETTWEQLRIEQGRPMPDHELTEEFNPLEAGLWHTISLNKGCYIGQETIARLHTYRGVKQQLWGLRFKGEVEPGTPVMAGEEKIGKLTSCTTTESGSFGLAYIRTKSIVPDLKVRVGETEGELVPIPFVNHDYP